jgi:hypothetical protein
LAEDLSRTGRAAATAIESVIVEVRRDGVPYEWSRRCEEEGRDGTRLGGCVKFYLPRPAGRWAVEAERLRDRPPQAEQVAGRFPQEHETVMPMRRFLRWNAGSHLSPDPFEPATVAGSKARSPILQASRLTENIG